MKKNKVVKKRHTFYLFLLKPLARLFCYFKLGYRYKDKYKIAKGESVVVLSNHQTDFDPILIHLSFNKLLHTLATDNIFKKGLVGHLLTSLGAIPKRKGATDLKAALEMKRVIDQGGSLLFFPEGNRSYAEFQYYIADSIGRSIKNYKATIILFNLHGGVGKYPRFAHLARSGKFYGKIRRILKYEDYKNMPDEDLTNLIKEELKVFDSDSKELFKSNKKAEYIERMLFTCPICGQKESLVSKGNVFSCNNCHTNYQYNEDLSLSSDNPNFKFTRLLDWYNYQKEFVKKMKINSEEIIFTDHDVKLYTSEPLQNRVLLAKGVLKVSDKVLVVNNKSFDIKNIEIASPVSGTKLLFTYNGEAYMVKGDKRFNPLKYVLLFNRLETKMKLEHADHYFSLD